MLTTIRAPDTHKCRIILRTIGPEREKEGNSVVPDLLHDAPVVPVEGVGAGEVFVVLVVGVRPVAHVRQANREEVRPQSSYGVLHDVGGKLRAGGSEGEDAYHAVDVVDPVGDLHAQEDHLAAIVGSVEVLR